MSAPNTQELKDLREWGREQALPAPLEEIFRPGSEARFWIKADGTLTGTKLPTDTYHMNRYRRRGWRLGPLIKPVELPLPDDHRHAFPRAMGSACRTDSRCDAVRTQRFVKRKHPNKKPK